MLDGLAYSVEYWIKPDMTVMKMGYYESFKTLDGEAGWYINDDFNLEIFTTQVDTTVYDRGDLHKGVVSLPRSLLYVISRNI